MRVVLLISLFIASIVLSTAFSSDANVNHFFGYGKRARRAVDELSTELSLDRVRSVDNLKILASRVLSAMNTHVDPCNDFFEYACGAWNSNSSNDKYMPRAFAIAESTFNVRYVQFRSF